MSASEGHERSRVLAVGLLLPGDQLCGVLEGLSAMAGPAGSSSSNRHREVANGSGSFPRYSCCVSGYRGLVSREIVDVSGSPEGLVVACGVEGEFADELAGVCVDDADVAVGDEELDRSSLVGSADADVVESAVVA